MSAATKVKVCRTLDIDGEDVDCVVTCSVIPGGGDNRTEPRYGADLDEVVSVRTDDILGQAIDSSLWPPGLEDDVRDAAVEAFAEQEADYFEPSHCDDDFGDGR